MVQAVTQPDEVREMVKNYVAADDDIEVEIPDYEHLEKPLVEVFTLDSRNLCSLHLYDGSGQTRQRIPSATRSTWWNTSSPSRKISPAARRWGVKNLPSIYINGQLKFSSIVPSKEELDAAINEVLN